MIPAESGDASIKRTQKDAAFIYSYAIDGAKGDGSKYMFLRNGPLTIKFK